MGRIIKFAVASARLREDSFVKALVLRSRKLEPPRFRLQGHPCEFKDRELAVGAPNVLVVVPLFDR